MIFFFCKPTDAMFLKQNCVDFPWQLAANSLSKIKIKKYILCHKISPCAFLYEMCIEDLLKAWFLKTKTKLLAHFFPN